MLTPEQKQNVAEWLYNLEADIYPQGRSCLVTFSAYDGKRYCCLGVAAEKVLHNKDYDKTAMRLTDEDSNKLGLDQELTKEERDILYDNRTTSHLFCGNRHDLCIHMNDSMYMTFPQIAAVFRKMGWDND